MKNYDVIVIGGGLSGLSAAVNLSTQGKKVLLLEQNKHYGGRSYSFIDKKTGDFVDNGQHLMMGCYRATRQFLKIIGTEKQAFLQSALSIKFLDSNKLSKFICPRLPAPFNLISGLIHFNAIPLKDRIKMLKVVRTYFPIDSLEERLNQITVNEWLSRNRQTELSKKYFWNVITLGALNNHPQNVSALMLYRVLRTAFSGSWENSSLLIPKVGLSDLFVEPAVNYIKSQGGDAWVGVSADKFYFDSDKIQSVATTTGEQLKAKAFISAVPWFSFKKIIASSSLSDKIKVDTSKFVSSPIISIHIWFEDKFFDFDFAALVGTRIQWLFNKNKIAIENGLNTRYQYISIVISGAQNFIELTNKELLKIAMNDLGSVIPGAERKKIINFLVIKERRATFSPTINLEIYRPNAKTEVKNLFIAGDWTNTGFPATIEGAIMSGNKAVEELNKSNL